MPVLGSKNVPVDKINLRLILVSGKTKEYLFSPSESAGDIAQFVFDNWPPEWEEEAVSKAEILRLIYQGRFLHGNVTLVCPGAAHGEDGGDAPCPEGESPGTIQSRRSPQEEDSWLTLLWGHGLRHSLG